MSLFVLLFSATIPHALAFTESVNQSSEDGVNIEIKQIDEIAKTEFGDTTNLPSQALAELAARVVNTDGKSNGNFYYGSDVLKYLYPNDSETALKNEGISAEQVIEWLHSIGYTATLINRSLTTSEIKEKLDDSQPMITILDGQNSDDWLNRNNAGVLYAHDDVEAGTEKLHKSFIKSYNFGEATIEDGAEASSFTFSDMANSPDPTQSNNSYKWVQTITDIKKDPSWDNIVNIREDRKNGVFNVKLTKEGTNVVAADFTDDDVTKLRGMYDKNIPSSATKLAAVSLINLYLNSEHQKTVSDLEQFAKISSTTDATSQQIEDWYRSLGFTFDLTNEKTSKDFVKSQGSQGKLYLSVLKARDSKNDNQHAAIIGNGFVENTSGFFAYWQDVKNWEQFTPVYDVDWSQPDAFQKQTEKMKAFNFDRIQKSIGDPQAPSGVAGDYDVETSLYNLREKDAPSTTINTDATKDFTESNGSNLSTNSSTVANYHTNPEFAAREVQGQEPWCSEYVGAAEINVLDKATTSGTPVTSAKQIMQELYPGVPDEQLKTMSGPTINELLKLYQSKYQMTADVEDRALSFDEVKKEIDNGQIIQLDAENLTAKDPEGKDDNTGHSMAIVGYVSGPDSAHTPYYEIWNPWWKQTFYVSTKSATINLAGQSYKWNRTWHNWHKTGVGVKSTLESSIGNEKVASTINPVAQRYSDTYLGKGIANQNVYQFGQPETLIDIITTGITFWYAFSTDNTRIQVGLNNAMTFGDNRQNTAVGTYVTDFDKLYAAQKDLIKTGIWSLPGADLEVLALALSGPLTKPALKVIAGILALFGIKVGITDLASSFRNYKNSVNNLQVDFVNALNESQGR